MLNFEKYQKEYTGDNNDNTISDELKNKINELINSVRDYDYYLLKNISKKILFEGLDEIFDNNNYFFSNINNCLEKSFGWNRNENISILYYTKEIDFFNHLYGKNHIYTMLHVYITEKIILKLIDWIDINEDYALIINSDYGGQDFYDEDTIKMHGEDYHGNEGLLFIYTKEFKENYNNLKMTQRYIDILDVNAIISEILKDINIPLESKGIPYKLINDDIYAYYALKMKENQLIYNVK